MMHAMLAQQSIADLPPAVHIIVGLGLGVGLVLWLFGARLLRPMFGALGAVLGSLLGFFLIPSVLPQAVFEVPSPYIGAALGGIIGLVVGILIFRFAMGAGMAVVGAIGGILVMAAALNSTAVNNTAAAARGALPSTAALQEASREFNPLAGKELRESTGPIATRVREFVDEKSAEVKAAWDEVPQREQVRLGMAGLGGLFVGLCLGLLMPRKSAAACTAFLGAAIWLPALGWVLHALEAPGRNLLDQKGLVWLIVWICLSCLGLAVQVIGSRTRKKASEAP